MYISYRFDTALIEHITFWVRNVCNLLIINFSISYDKKSLQWDG